LHTAAVSGGLLLGVFARRGATPGLERFPPQRQVRRHDLLPALVMASVLVTAALAVWRRDDPWVVTTAIVVLVELVLLSMVRQVGLGRETRRLYGEVERAADERLDLLADVMRSLDGDRARAAAQLHRQAAKLYTAMALSTGAEVATAQRVRVDLARQVDLSHQVLSVMRVGVGEDAGIDRLALTRAYIGALYADAPSPALEIEIDERLILDWMDEAVAFRIVQLAVHNIWRHAGASCIRVALRAQDDALVVTVDDDGVGFDPAGVMVGSGTGIATMRALADLVGGHVEIASGSGRGGTCVRAVLGRGPAPAPAPIEPRRPALRVIR
jgi:signal transduction histidine kinase